MSITTTSVDKATVILVHGAFAESSSWNGVIAPLLDDGYPVLAVANPLRGVKSDSDYLHSVLLVLVWDQGQELSHGRPSLHGRRAGSRRTVELQGGSHAVAIPEAAAVVDLIREAATGGAVR
jgi:hypothetical protein